MVEVEMPDTVENTGGAFLKEKGVYHVAVIEVTETPTKKNGELIGDAAFGVEVEVLAGPQAKKQKDVIFFNPDPSKPKDSTGYQLSLRKIRRFLEATCVVAERVPGGNTYTVDPTKAMGRQLIMEFDNDSREGKEKNLQLAWANIWHVDDPDTAAKCERSQEHLKLLPASLRRDPKSFEKPKAASGSNGNGSAGQQSQQKQTADVDLDAL